LRSGSGDDQVCQLDGSRLGTTEDARPATSTTRAKRTPRSADLQEIGTAIAAKAPA
jgi:hypothetical protein